MSRDPAFNPPRVSIFDHGHALFGTNVPIGRENLEHVADQLGCENSALIRQELDIALLEQWVERVKALPAFLFEDICREVAQTRGLNVGTDEAQALAAWLVDRAQRVGRLIRNNEAAFPAVNWALWPLDGPPS